MLIHKQHVVLLCKPATQWLKLSAVIDEVDRMHLIYMAAIPHKTKYIFIK